MKRLVRPWLLVVLAAGCNSDPQAPPLLDTGWFTSEDAPGCPHTVVSTSPEADVDDWYYRDAPRIFTSTVDPDGYDVTLADAEGRLVPTTEVWSAENSTLTLEPDGPLPPDTDFEIVVQDCERTTTVPFRTSELGLPLTPAGQDLAGRTYRLDLAGASWRRPEGLGPIIASFLTEPILLGVVYVDAERIDLLGAPSSVDDLGVVSQADEPTWEFPIASFDAEDPTFSVTADAIELLVAGNDGTTTIPVTDFALSGTLSANGTRLGGGGLAGIADTRSIADGLFGSDNAICELAETSFQLSCSPCPSDSEPFCLDLEAESVRGTEQPGLTLVTIAP
ncbi:MAG: hypothetical protein AAF602_15600 [Myxococcota bacterium]